jgi:hypothetical protein
MDSIEAAATATRIGARLRGARLLHPRGRSFTGEWETFGTPHHRWGAALLDGPDRQPVTVRVSKGAPTPTGWPDVLGLAVRLPGAGRDTGPDAGPDAAAGPVDLLFSSALRTPILRHVPWPRRHFGNSYGTLLAYRAGSARVFLATRPARDVGTTLDDVARAASSRGVSFIITAATRWGPWRPVAVLRFGTPLGADVDAALAFNPIAHHAPDLVPVGWVQRLRGTVYRASQHGRGAVPADGQHNT